MGQTENMEVVREAARLFEAADWQGFGELFTENAELKAVDDWPEPGPFHGRADVVAEFRRLQESWGTNRVVIEEATGEGDWMVVGFRWIVEGASSGLPGEMKIFVAGRFEDAQFAQYLSFWEREEALEAAGLTE
jgi:ketosteroid isomerase-like protein